MTESHRSTRDSRLASADQQRPSGDDRPGGSRLLALGSLGAVLFSVLGSVAAAGLLPDRMRIHWTLGLGPYYGPEFAPTLLVLTVFPVAVGATALAAYWGAGRLRDSGEFDTLRPFYALTVFGTLTALLATQGVLIVANL